MTLWRLVLKEVLHRKVNFALGVVSVLVAVGCLVAELTVLRAHDVRTEEIIKTKERETKERMRRLEDETRKIMKKLGFNVIILPKEQNLADLYAKDYASNYMPEGYAKKLADSGIMTIRHLLPSLRQRVEWPERQDRIIILIGVRGEVPALHRDPKNPILYPVPPGTMVVGYHLHKSLGLSPGDKVKLLKREFTVGKCHPERGNKDDITIWVNLDEAQELLSKQGRINEMLALKCHCVGVDIGKIREEITRVLPDTQVVELATKAFARAAARDEAAVAARRMIAAERRNREELRQEREQFAALLVPVVIVGCTVWIGFLAFSNARERRAEIGILRAIGLRSRNVFCIFLAKAALIGFAGALLGYFVGLGVGTLFGEAPLEAQAARVFWDPVLLLQVVLVAPVLSGLASWIPAMMAAQQDPAVVLLEE